MIIGRMGYAGIEVFPGFLADGGGVGFPGGQFRIARVENNLRDFFNAKDFGAVILASNGVDAAQILWEFSVTSVVHIEHRSGWQQILKR